MLIDRRLATSLLFAGHRGAVVLLAIGVEGVAARDLGVGVDVDRDQFGCVHAGARAGEESGA